MQGNVKCQTNGYERQVCVSLGFNFLQETTDTFSHVHFWGYGGITLLIFLKLQESCSKCWPYYKRVGYNVFREHFSSNSRRLNVQMVKAPLCPYPHQWKVSCHISQNILQKNSGFCRVINISRCKVSNYTTLKSYEQIPSFLKSNDP